MSNYMDEGGSAPKLVIDDNSKNYLLEVCKWAKFLAIIGFIFIGLMVLFALLFGTIMGSTSRILGDESGGARMLLSGGAFTVLYLIMAAIYFFPILYLYRFATNTRAALLAEDQSALIGGMEYLKKHYKFIGIIAIIIMAFYALGFVIALLFGSTAFF